MAHFELKDGRMVLNKERPSSDDTDLATNDGPKTITGLHHINRISKTDVYKELDDDGNLIRGAIIDTSPTGRSVRTIEYVESVIDDEDVLGLYQKSLMVHPQHAVHPMQITDGFKITTNRSSLDEITVYDRETFDRAMGAIGRDNDPSVKRIIYQGPVSPGI